LASRSLDNLRYAVIDTETTGFYPSRDRVVEVAVEVVNSRGEREDRYATLVNPGQELVLNSAIEPRLLLDAPRFDDVAGDVLERLSGAVWVGHNIGFDVGFLRAEFGRMGFRLPEAPSLCTMRLSHHFGPKMDCYRLEWLCDALGIQCTGEHTTERCAAATAELFLHLLGRARSLGKDSLDDFAKLGFDSVVEPFLSPDTLPFPPSGKALPRDMASASAPTREPSYIRRLVANLRPARGAGVSDDQLGFYLHLLDRVVQDRRIDSDEQDQLLELAHEWDFALEDVRRAHDIYVGMLIATALDDGVITPAEQEDLEAVCQILGVSPETLRATLERARGAPGSAG